MKRRTWHRLVTRALVLLLPAATLLAVGSPAQAYTCSGGQPITVTGSVSKVTLTFYPRCSDNKAHWRGVIRDTLCDARSGKVILWPYVWEHSYQANNGCGTSASYSGSDSALRSPWEMAVMVGACNSISCSGYFTKYLYG
jgi:hypothetical protein